MSAEIPEIFRALLEHPFTLPNFEDNGKWLSSQTVKCVLLGFSHQLHAGRDLRLRFRAKLITVLAPFLNCLQTTACLLRNPCQLSWTGTGASGWTAGFGSLALVRSQWLPEYNQFPSGAVQTQSSVAVFNVFSTLPATS